MIASPDSASEPTHFSEYWQVIRSRAGSILLLFLLTLGSGYFTTVYLLHKIYGGTAQIRILRQDKQIEVFQRSDSLYFDPVFFQSEIETIKSQSVLYPIIERLKLREAWSMRYFKGLRDLRMEEAYELLLKKYLEVEPKRGSNVLEITGLSEDPQEAAAIANAVADIYVETRRAYESKKTTSGLENLRNEIEKQQVEVKRCREKIETLRKELGVDSLPNTQGEGQLTDLELQRKNQMLDEARFDLMARQVRYEQLQKLSLDQLIDALPALGFDDPNLSQARQQQLQTDAQIANLKKSGFGDDHPRVRSLLAQSEELKRQLQALVDGKRAALAIDLEVSKNKTATIEKDVADLKNKVRDEKSAVLAPFREAQEEAVRQQNILEAFIIRFKQESVDTKVEGDPALLISRAEPGDRPVKPILILNLILSGVAGLVLGLSTAFFIEYLDTSVKTIGDIEKTLGLPVLGIVPVGVKPLNQEEVNSPHAECYRILRARLDLRPGGKHGNTLTALSGGPGEGKSTTIFNLAYVCAQSGLNTLIVDADLRRPSQHTILGLAPAHGLADAITSGQAFSSFVQATIFPNLYLLPAGEFTTESINHFSAEFFHTMLEELRALYQIILIDSPPALGISDASIICHEVDQTLLVIQHRRYPREVTIRAKKAIEEVQGKLTGVVLNAVALNNQEGYYHYGAYRDYYHKKPKKSAANSSKKNPDHSHESTAKPPSGRRSSDTF